MDGMALPIHDPGNSTVSNQTNCGLCYLTKLDPCDITKSITGQTVFAPLAVVGTLIGLLSIAPNALLVWATLRTTIYPANLRCLMAHLSANLACYGLAVASKYIQLLTGMADPCGLAIKAYSCKLRDSASSLSWTNILYSLAGICLERLYCSVNYRTYDKPGSKPWLACVVGAIIWTATLFLNLYQLSLVDRDRMIPFCDSQFTSASETMGLQVLSAHACLEILGVITIISLYTHDKMRLKSSAINRAKYTLAERFQIQQCVQVHSLLAPSVILHTVCYLPNVATLLLSRYGVALSIESKWMWSQIATIYKLAYAMAHPLLALTRNVHLKKKVRSSTLFQILIHPCMPQNSTPKKPANVVTPTRTIERHIDVMENVWTRVEKNKTTRK